MPIAANLDRPALLDHIPALLDQMAEMADELSAGSVPTLPTRLAEVHAMERLDEGFDLSQVVAEYGALRNCIMQLWAEQSPEAASTHALHDAIDRAVAASVQRFSLARDRTLRALDRISAAALEARTLDELLERLLAVFTETTAAVDSAMILLREGDVLRVRACVGCDDRIGTTISLDDGFAGSIARTRLPHVLQPQPPDPRKALFGIPMIDGGELIGVAHMGSLTAPAFSLQDQRLFVAMVNRATAAISLHVLREREQSLQRAVEEALQQRNTEHAAAERTLAVMDTILSASALGIAFIDTDLRYLRINDALAGLNGVPAAQHIGRTVREVLGDEAAGTIEPVLRRIIETREPVEHAELSVEGAGTFVASYVPVVTGHGELLGIGAVVIDVTVRKRLENELRHREMKFRTLADNIPQLAWMADEAGNLTWYNRRWYEYTGTTFEQMQGSGWRAVHHADHVERVVEKFARHIASGEIWEDTFPLRGADGSYRWFLSRAMPIHDEHGRVWRWFGTNTDVTEHRVMHEAMTVLSSSRDYHETLERVIRLAVPALGDWGAIDLVEDGRIERVALAHSDPTKIALARELTAQAPRDPDAPYGVDHVIRTGVTEHVRDVGERFATHPARSRIATELGLSSYVIAPLIARDRTLGAISFVSAESARQFTQEDIATIEELGRRCALAVDNARLFADAQRETRMREELLAVVSHDLKNPLQAIHLAAVMLLQQTDARARKQLETILRATGRMDHLIGDLLDMASIQAGRLAIERKPVSLDPIVREAIESHEPAVREKGLTIARACDLPDAIVCADRERILQVLGNLIGNAIKFCSSGQTITISCEADAEATRLAVADTGPGIAEAELPHIFEPYWSAKKYAKKGTGLGLYISKGIVEAHGGRMWVESELGAGTTFHFTIPFA